MDPNMYHLKRYRPSDSFCTFISESVPYIIFYIFYVIYKYLNYSFIMVILNIIIFLFVFVSRQNHFPDCMYSNENTIFELQ